MTSRHTSQSKKVQKKHQTSGVDTLFKEKVSLTPNAGKCLPNADKNCNKTKKKFFFANPKYVLQAEQTL
jgi:hypothetical protein